MYCTCTSQALQPRLTNAAGVFRCTADVHQKQPGLPNAEAVFKVRCLTLRIDEEGDILEVCLHICNGEVGGHTTEPPLGQGLQHVGSISRQLSTRRTAHHQSSVEGQGPCFIVIYGGRCELDHKGPLLQSWEETDLHNVDGTRVQSQLHALRLASSNYFYFLTSHRNNDVHVEVG